MARLKTAQPNSSLRKIAVVVATAVSGMSVYAQAAVQPKEETITVTAAPAPQESAWGPAPTIAAKRSATTTKTDTPIEKRHSRFRWSLTKRCRCINSSR